MLLLLVTIDWMLQTVIIKFKLFPNVSSFEDNFNFFDRFGFLKIHFKGIGMAVENRYAGTYAILNSYNKLNRTFESKA